MALQLSLLILAAVCPALVQANTICDSHYLYGPPFFDWQYSLLYSKLEEALINNQTILNILKHGFISTEDVWINFSVHLEVENGTDLSSRCDNSSSSDTFCPKNSSNNVWELCDDNGYDKSLTMSFISPTFDASKFKMFGLVVWLSSLHGNFVTSLIQSMANQYYFKILFAYDEGDITLRLKIDTLKCNPPLPLTECALSELISWVKIYSYSKPESRPQTWDKNQKGTVVFSDELYIIDYFFINPEMGWATFGLSEYVLVSLSLALIIATFFPAIHNQIVSRASTTLEYKSLYWGMAVVSNALIYGLVFAVGRGLLFMSFLVFNSATSPKFIVPCVQELVVHVVLFIGALIASLESEHDIPIPIKGMAKVVINISFCFSCFCCCVCCSPRCRAKTMRVLVLFSFMSFVYRGIMDAISMLFIKFVDDPTAFFILMYISLLTYLIFSVSYSLFMAFQNEKLPLYRQCVTCLGSICMLITIFSAVIIMFAMYIFLYISLRPSGLNGIVAGLLPSITLSAVSWYIKIKLLNSVSGSSKTPVGQLEYGTMCKPVNDGGQDPADTNGADYQTLMP